MNFKYLFSVLFLCLFGVLFSQNTYADRYIDSISLDSCFTVSDGVISYNQYDSFCSNPVINTSESFDYVSFQYGWFSDSPLVTLYLENVSIGYDFNFGVNLTSGNNPFRVSSQGVPSTYLSVTGIHFLIRNSAGSTNLSFSDSYQFTETPQFPPYFSIELWAYESTECPPCEPSTGDLPELTNITKAIYVLAGTLLVLYFFYTIYRLIIRNSGVK